MAVAGIDPGDTVADFIPGTGYYSRILCALVRESGRLYTVTIELQTKDPDFDRTLFVESDARGVAILLRRNRDLREALVAILARCSLPVRFPDCSSPAVC